MTPTAIFQLLMRFVRACRNLTLTAQVQMQVRGWLCGEYLELSSAIVMLLRISALCLARPSGSIDMCDRTLRDRLPGY